MSDPSGGVVSLLRAARAASDVPSVAVLVDLVRTSTAGGQVKCWEHFAEAAAGMSPADLGVDLTVYTLGEAHRVERLSPTVRFVALPPLFSTAPLVREAGVDVCDLSPRHPALHRLLPLHTVWHLTHMFSLANTAVRLSRTQRRTDRPNSAGLVGSVHTDVPALASTFVQERAGRVAGALTGGAGPHAVPAYLGDLSARLVRRHRDRLLHACDRVLVATPQERTDMAAVVGKDRVSLLGRGVNHGQFRPDPSARAELIRRHGVPADRTVVLFAGRADASKRLTLLAQAVRRLRDEGRAVHLVVAGTGHETERVSRLLGLDATLLGTVSQERLGRVYAGCDVFALPSLTETIGNVVGEAMACGLPVVLPAGARTTQWLTAPGEDGLVVTDDSAAGWAAVLATLVDNPTARAEMGRRAAATARAIQRTWTEVLNEDLVPVWRQVAPPRPPMAG